MKCKEVVIGAMDGYGWNDVAWWCQSLLNTGFKGRAVLFTYGVAPETMLRAIRHGIEIVGAGGSLRHHAYKSVKKERYRLYSNFISELGTDECDRVIATDVRDIVFQKDPSNWLDEHMGESDVVISSENIFYGDEEWNSRNALEVYGREASTATLWNQPVFNSGVIAGSPLATRDLFDLVYRDVYRKPSNSSDQIVFNHTLRVHGKRWKLLQVDHRDAWACHGAAWGPELSAVARCHHSSPAPSIAGGSICNVYGREYTIVHQYDRFDSWKSLLGAQLPPQCASPKVPSRERASYFICQMVRIADLQQQVGELAEQVLGQALKYQELECKLSSAIGGAGRLHTSTLWRLLMSFAKKTKRVLRRLANKSVAG